jgi:archaellum biogenesis ATPase FlaH
MSKIIVNKKVIVDEIIIPAEYAEEFKDILNFYEESVSLVNKGKISLAGQKALTFARQVLRKMNGEEA